jgi:hypothetical protein
MQGNAMDDFDPLDLTTGSAMIGSTGWDQFEL